MTLNEFLALTQIDLRNVERGTITIELFDGSHFGNSIYENVIQQKARDFNHGLFADLNSLQQLH